MKRDTLVQCIVKIKTKKYVQYGKVVSAQVLNKLEAFVDVLGSIWFVCNEFSFIICLQLLRLTFVLYFVFPSFYCFVTFVCL